MAGTSGASFTPEPGVRLGYEVVGDDAGLPVVLLHGLSQQRAFWGPVVRRLRARPVAVLDQRGHGSSDTPVTADFSVGACGTDVLALLDHLGWNRAVVVGHSWGAAVALAAAARDPRRVTATVLVDGGLWAPVPLAERGEARRRLTPPALGIPAADLWSRMRQGDLADSWDDEVRAALAPTFTADAAGLLRTRIGVDRHLRVLDGLLDHDGVADLATASAHGVPVWVVVCSPVGAPRPSARDELDGSDTRAAGVREASRLTNCRVLRWAGAVHDVPLQWPALVAGLVDTAVETGGGRRS